MPDLQDLIRTFVDAFGKKKLGTYAASTTYGMLLSVFPALILVSATLPYTALSESDITEFLLSVFPDESAGLVMQVCGEAYQTSGAALPISIILMLWSAGFGMMQLTRGLNAINDVEETRNYFFIRLMSTLYTILVLALMVAVLLLQIFFRQIVGLWESALPSAEMPSFLSSTLRYLVLFGLGLVLFELLFTRLPATSQNPLTQLPGALVAAVGWEVFSAIFSLYVRYSQNLDVYYGSLTTAIVLLLWVYWCVYIMLFGAFLNRFIELHISPGMRSGSAPKASADSSESSASDLKA